MIERSRPLLPWLVGGPAHGQLAPNPQAGAGLGAWAATVAGATYQPDPPSETVQFAEPARYVRRPYRMGQRMFDVLAVDPLGPTTEQDVIDLILERAGIASELGRDPRDHLFGIPDA